MFLKSRFLRYVLIGLLILVAVAYGAFATLFFNPLESDLDEDVAALVPRDVDFFVAKADLGGAFDSFPRLSVLDQLEQKPAWTSFTASPQGKKLAQDLQIEPTLARLREAVAQLPLGIQPQDAFGGRDLAIAGYFRGPDLALADWAVYGRSNWAGKLAAAALDHPKLLRLDERGLVVEEHEGSVAVSGPQIPRKIFVTRIQDVVILSTQADLPKKAHDLVARGFEDSFFQSAAYYDWVQKPVSRSAERDELEFYVDARKAIESLQLPKAWPDAKSQEFTTSMLGRIFQLGSVKDVIGFLGIDQGISLDLHGDLSSEQITPEQERLYRTRGIERDALLGEAARLAPRDTALFVYLHAPVADLLNMMLASCEPALRQNLEDQMRNTGKYPSLAKLVAELDASLKDRAALILRPNDYPADPDGPPHDDAPVPAMALVLWPKDVEPLNALRQLIGEQGSKFGLKGRRDNDPGFFKNNEAGYETREYWSYLVPGTGIVVTANAADLTIVTNSLGMMGHLLKTYTQRSDKYPSLADDGRFHALVQSALPQANLIVWANPQTAAPILRNRAQRVAENSFTVDNATEVPRVEAKLLREEFAGRKKADLSPAEQATFDARVDDEMRAMRQRLKAEQVPALMAEQERWITWMEAATGALLVLALDPKSFDLALRITVPLDAQ
jgi:hypothetical protein